MGLTVFSAPQHKLTLVSNLVQGDVIMGVRPPLPMGGVQVILGNDLAGSRVWPDVPVDTISSQVGNSESPKTPSVVLPTCAVTRATSRASGDSCFEHSDKKRESISFVPAFPLPVSCSDLVKEQKDDPTLHALYNQLLPDDEVESAAQGYFLQDGLLVRKWVPQGECFMGMKLYKLFCPLV